MNRGRGRGVNYKGRLSSTRGSPESSMRSMRNNSRDRQMKKDRRSHSPIGRRLSPKRGPRPFTRSSRSPLRMSNRGRGSASGNNRTHASPIRRPSLSPHRKSSPNMKRRSPNLQSKSSTVTEVKRTSHGGHRPQANSTVRRSFSPRRTDSRIHSNARSQSSRGRPFHKLPAQRPLSRSPVAPKKKRLSPNSASHQSENRRTDTASINDNSQYKEGRIADKSHHLDHRGDAALTIGRGHRFSVQREDASYNTGDIDERFERHSPSPQFKKDERYNMDGTFREIGRGFPNEMMPREQGNEDRLFAPTGANNRPMGDESIGREPNATSGINLGTGKIYTQEELKTITVDIFRSVPQENAIGKRNNFNPNDVVVVRRSGEGVRPIFDRDEIRLAHVERGDGAFVERRVVAIVKERSRSHSPRINSNVPQDIQGLEERENFQISSEHFNSYGPNDHVGSTRPSLNDRWQKLECRNIDREAIAMGNRKNMQREQRDLVSPEYQNRDSHNDYVYRRSPERSRSTTPDCLRQYSDSRYSEQHPEYSNEWAARRGPRQEEERDRYGYEQNALRRRYLPVNPHDLRHSLATKRRQSMDPHPRTTRYSEDRDRGRDWNRERNFRDNRLSRSRERGIERRAPDTTTDTHNRDVDRGRPGNEANWDRQNERDGRDMFNQGRLPNFSSRPDKYRYQEWLDKPDVVPKGPSYFEHDTRGDAYARDPHSRGFGIRGRGRGFPTNRGGRGNFRARGAPFSYNSKSPFNRPGNKWSPNQWKHDRFETSPDRMSEQDNKPSSTTNK